MRPIHYSINVTVDGCCDHREVVPNARTHAHATANVASADAIILGRVTYRLMEDGWREVPPDLPDWVLPFAETITQTTKYVVSRTLPSVDWHHAELLDVTDLRGTIEDLKAQPGGPLALGGVDLPRTLARWGLIDQFELVVHPTFAGHGPYLFEGLETPVPLRMVDREQIDDDVVALRYEPVRS